MGKEGFEELAKDVNSFIELNGKPKGLMIYTEIFPSWRDFAALISHPSFAMDHKKFIERVAAVTDSSLLSLLSQV